MVESKGELKNLLMKVKEKNEKAALKLNIQKAKIMTSGPITSWQIDGEKWKQWQTLLFWAPKSDGDYSHEIKRHLLLGRKPMRTLSSILKSRDITLLTIVHVVKTIFFLVVMYGCANWTIKKAECWRTDTFKSCWRRLLRVPWTTKRSNQSILKEINPEYSLEGLMLKMKLQYFGHLMQTADSLQKIPMLGKIEGRKRRVLYRIRWLELIIDSMDMSLSKLREIVKDREMWCTAVHEITKSWTGLSDWITTKLWSTYWDISSGINTQNWKS